MENCIFCKIKNGEISSEKLYQDNDFFIIKDINPQAKIHLVAIPNYHVGKIANTTEEQALILGKILHKISSMQKELGLTNGYRLLINQGQDAGQTVDHIHIHILAGEKLKDF